MRLEREALQASPSSAILRQPRCPSRDLGGGKQKGIPKPTTGPTHHSTRSPTRHSHSLFGLRRASTSPHRASEEAEHRGAQCDTTHPHKSRRRDAALGKEQKKKKKQHRTKNQIDFVDHSRFLSFFCVEGTGESGYTYTKVGTVPFVWVGTPGDNPSRARRRFVSGSHTHTRALLPALFFL